MSSNKDRALLIIAYGSTVNPDSSAPTLAHAAEFGTGKFVRMAPVCCVKFLIVAKPELLSAANGIDAGKRQEIDHTKALWRPIVGRQRW